MAQLRHYYAAGNVTLASSATDIFDIFGAVGVTTVVTRVTVHGIATSANQADMLLLRRSTANSGGTRAAMTAVPTDPLVRVNALSIPGLYSGNPTTGTVIGAVGRAYVPLSTNGGSNETGHDWIFLAYPPFQGRSIYLSGPSQGLVLNLNGVTISGGALSVECEWYEF